MRVSAHIVVVLVAACAITRAHGQCSDPFDDQLCVYPVYEADTQFATDGQVSPFWSDWAARDYIEMNPPGSCYPDRCGFSGPEDAAIIVKAAGTSRGLYVLVEIHDNTWVDRADAEDWGADAIDFYFDKLSADDIWSCNDCLIGLYSSTLTYTTYQFQVWMGATGVPAGCRFAYYDDNLWSWQTVGVTWDAATALYGYEAEAIQVDMNTKAIEWFFPWGAYCKGLDEGTVLDGMRLALSGGYNDKDGDNVDPHCLRWLGKDPWSGDANYWGDLVLQPGMGIVGSYSNITVLTPNGGESWETGSAQAIRWTSSGSVGNVRIEYSVNDGQDWGGVTASTPNDGSYTWTVPDQVSTACLVRIGDASDGEPHDRGDSTFAIVPPPPPSIEVVAPNGGESWIAGTSHSITWNSTGHIDLVKIERSIDSGATWSVVATTTSNDGVYAWYVPETISTTCLIRISDASDGDPCDTSDAVFAIVEPPPPGIALLSPNGGETWQQGAIQTIRWTSSGGVGSVAIEYSANAGADWAVVTNGTSNDGSYGWVVPRTPSDGCLVRVYEASDGMPADTSDTTFEILRAPSLTITAPNGGEVWQIGAIRDITWESSGTVGNVSIQYSTNGGASWRDVFSNTANDGSYAWPVPDTPSEECLVRIMQTSGGSPGDTSDAPFVLERPTAVHAGRPLPSSTELLAVTAGRGGGIGVSYALAAPRMVVAELYTVKGELIRRLKTGHCPVGYHELTWDGVNAAGATVRGGMCVLRLRLGDTVVQRGIALAR